MHDEFPARKLCKTEELVDQLFEFLGLFIGNVRVMRGGPRIKTVPLTPQNIEIADNGGERRAQVMCNVRDQLGFTLLRLALPLHERAELFSQSIQIFSHLRELIVPFDVHRRSEISSRHVPHRLRELSDVRKRLSLQKPEHETEKQNAAAE